MAVLDPVGDFIELTVSQGYDETATQIDIVAVDVHWANLPDPTTDGAYNLLWYDASNYWSNPQDDPNKEWVRVTNWVPASYRLIVTRAQQDTAATTKNTSGATYKMIMAIGKKFRDDIENSTVDVGSKYAWITEYGGVGDGVEDDRDAFVAAVADGTTHIVIPEGTWRFSDSYTIADTVTIECRRNAVLAPDTGKVLTLNCPIIAGNWTIIGGSGTVAFGNRCGIGYHRWYSTTNMVEITTSENEGVLSVRKAGTGTGDVLDVDNDGTGAGLYVAQGGNGTGVSISQVGTGVPLHISGGNGNCIIIGTAKTPASQTDTGVAGTICWDASYIYVCTATNYWERVAIAAW